MSEKILPEAVELLLQEIFEGTEDVRQATLNGLCAAHPELASTIRRRMQQARDFLDQLQQTEIPDASLVPPQAHPQQIGAFSILEVLGEGGMGIVYLAEQREPISRRVALKVIKAGMDTRRVLARFGLERQALAKMNHKGIARVLEAGTTGEGRPYFAMEYVNGQPITTWCDAHELSIKKRCELMLEVCAAVQHAHQKGVIHRDLKPSNVLVAEEAGGAPQPKIIDFGLARAIDQHANAQTLFTQQGMIVGTPEYMSPEQASMGREDVDTRSDVYSLGVVLYELLAGSLPFESHELRSASYAEMQRCIREDDPKKPSTRVSRKDESSEETAKRRHLDVGGLVHALRGDLDWITMRALAKERSRRYQTANELAADIGRHLRHEPVLASPPSMRYRVAKFLRRYRLQVAAAASVLVTLIAGLVVSLLLFVEARANAKTAQKSTEFLVTLFEYANPSRSLGEDIPISLILRQGVERIKHELEDEPLVRAELLATFGRVYASLAADEKALQFLEEAIELKARLKGWNDPSIFAWQQLQMNVLHVMGRAEAAEDLARETLARARRELPAGDRTIAACMCTYGQFLANRGRMQEAGQLLHGALEIYRKVYREDHPELARALRAVGNFMHDSGSHETAHTLLQEALAMQGRMQPEGHPEIILLLRSDARCLAALGRLEEAEKSIHRALEECLHIFGREHPDFVHTLHEKAFILSRSGRLDEAKPLLRRSIKSMEKLLRPEDPKLAWYLNDLGTLLLDQGRHREARGLLERALGIYRRIHSKDHLHLAICMQNNADALQRLGQLAAAEKLAKEGLDMMRRLEPGGGMHTASGLHLHGWILGMRGKVDEARKALRESVAKGGNWPMIGRPHLALAFFYNQEGKGQPGEEEANLAVKLFRQAGDVPQIGLALALYNAGWACLLQGKRARAEALFLESIEVFDGLFPEVGHPDLAWPLSHLGLILAGEGKREALPFFRRALEVRKRFLDEENPLLLTSLVNLAVVSADLESQATAEPLLLSAYQRLEKARGKAHPATRELRKRLFLLYERWGKPGKAQEYRSEQPKNGKK